ncbi:MAG: Ig-like domain-containing protein [Candidatus Methanoperedens sp.]|nr:Ig-like domain-containing protein [Candidatus Methanoperedens sp.]
MILKRIISDESGLTVAVETILLFSISVIFLGMIFLSFQGMTESQGKVLMQEEFQAIGQNVAKKLSDMNMEAKASLAAGSNVTIKSEFSMPAKISDNTYTVKLMDGKILVESTSGPYVSVEVPLSADIAVAENSSIYSFDETHSLEYDSRSGAMFFKDGGVTPPPDYNSPTIEIISPPAGTNLTGNAKINVSVWDDVIVTRVDYQVDGVYKYTAGSPFNWSWDTKTMFDGNYTVTAIAYDGAGHSKPASRYYNISNLVTDPPVITVLSPADLSTTDFRKPTIEVQISDDLGIDFSSISLLVDGINKIANATFSDNTTKHTTIRYTPAQSMAVAPPPHIVIITASDMDSIKHESSSSWSFEITPITDTDSPSTTILYPILSSSLSPGSPILVTYTASDGTSGLDNLSINVTRNDGVVYLHNETVSIYPTVVYTINPAWTYEFVDTYVGGKNYTYKITAYDRNGNSAFAVVGPLNVALPGQASELEVDTSGATSSGSKLQDIKLKDNVSDSVYPTITRVNISWSGSGQIEKVKFDGSTYWAWNGAGTPDGKQNSGTILTLGSAYTTSSVFKNMEITLSTDVAGKTFTIVFYLSDSTTSTVTFTAP